MLCSIIAEGGQRGQQSGKRHEPCQDAGSQQGAQPARLCCKDPDDDVAGHSRGRENARGEVIMPVRGSVAFSKPLWRKRRCQRRQRMHSISTVVPGAPALRHVTQSWALNSAAQLRDLRAGLLQA